MARQEKGTRARGLPPKVQLGISDNLSGAVPTVSRFSTDGRTGRDSLRFDDRDTIVFGRLTASYYPGFGIASGSVYLIGSGASDLPTSIQTSGANRSAVVDSLNLVSYQEPTRLSPFKEQNLFESDAKGLTTPNTFFATGSSETEIGPGFSSPLWSKQKIEIDISVNSQSTLNLKRSTTAGSGPAGQSFPMAYYNFSNKTWDPLGMGFEINAFPDAENTIYYVMYGFGSGLLPRGSLFTDVKPAGYCLSDFGFPYHPKFHATSSQTLSMRNYITQPFLLEKAVITVSGAWSIGSVNLSAYNQGSRSTITSSINTCFLMNQRRNQNLRFYKRLADVGPIGFAEYSFTIPDKFQLDPNGDLLRVDTIRDLIGFSQIYSFASASYDKIIVDNASGLTSSPGSTMAITSNDVILTNPSVSNVSGANWSGLVRMSMSMCTPSAGTYEYEYPQTSVTGGFNSIVLRFDSIGDYDEPVLGYGGYRTGLGIRYPSTRGLVGDFYRNPKTRTADLVGTYVNVQTEVTEDKHKINPYILQPDDQLVLGWQIPYSDNPAQLTNASSNESTFTFFTGSFSMTLYGSYIREGAETNDTTNQLLTSKAIHEIIG